MHAYLTSLSISLRQTVEVFTVRISELEDFIRNHSLAVPAADPLVAKIMAKILHRTSGVPADLLPSLSGGAAGPTPAPDSSPSSAMGATVSVRDNGEDASTEPTVSATSTIHGLDSTTPVNYLSDDLSRYNFHVPDWTVDLSLFSHAGHELSGVYSEPTCFSSNETSSSNCIPPAPWDWSASNGLPYCLQDLASFESSMPGNEDQDSVVSRLADTRGTLHNFDNGDLRYFGATANISLLDSEPPFDDLDEVDTHYTRGKRMMEEAGLDQAIDPQLIEHFIHLYFAWQDSSFHVVDRDAYEKQRCRYMQNPGVSRHHAEALTNIM